MVNEVEHLFFFFLNMLTSHLDVFFSKFFFKYFAHLKTIVLILLIYRNSFSIRDVNQLPNICITDIFFQSVAYLFTFLIVSFD